MFRIKRTRKREKKTGRITFLAVFFFLLGVLIAGRLFQLQVLNYKTYHLQALKIRRATKTIEPKRGEIFVQDPESPNGLHLIATNRDLYLVYAVPKLIVDPEETAKKLSELLDVPYDTLLQRLSKENDPYEPIKHFVESKKVEEIKKLDIKVKKGKNSSEKEKAIGFLPEPARYYPDKDLFSHILGFTGYKGDKKVGQYGIEEYFDEILRGQEGLIVGERDALGRFIPISTEIKRKAEDGKDIILTLDYPIQFFACSELKRGIKKYGADSGTVIVMNPQTGAILALCNYPDFDPNEYNKVENINLFLNPAVSYTYEPGSVFKAITFAAALDTNKLTPTTTYEDKGEVKIGKYTIKNADLKAHGKKTMTQVLEESLNTGAIFAVQKTGKKIFKKYVEKFGFGKKTGIELPGEARGDISSLKKRGDIYTATASFGQGISVTPLQLIVAFSAIANQGKMMRPYLVEKIIDKNKQKIIEENKPKVLSQVISSQTASTLGAMLVSVVENGYGKKARVKGYYLAGKTGTALVSNPERRGYLPNKTIHSFCGFGPIDNPQFTILVKLDYPRAVRFAADSATPIFSRIAKFILDYKKIPPER